MPKARVHESGVPLSSSDRRAVLNNAKSQYKATLSYFKAIYPEGEIADNCRDKLVEIGAINKCPHSSIRRSCSDLKDDGLLEILENDRKEGRFGVMYCKYRYKPQPGVQIEAF